MMGLGFGYHGRHLFGQLSVRLLRERMSPCLAGARIAEALEQARPHQQGREIERMELERAMHCVQRDPGLACDAIHCRQL